MWATLYKKLYLARIADNMHVMLTSGISAVRALEITQRGRERGLRRYMLEALEGVKAGNAMSEAFARHYPDEIPAIMVQMLQIGEETGEMGPSSSVWPSSTTARSMPRSTPLSPLSSRPHCGFWPWRGLPARIGAPADLQHH
jgi:hypothetical protein